MPASKRPKPLYQRGDFRLYRREGRANLEIVWYDAAAGRERSVSAGTGDDEAARAELDRRYLIVAGKRVCEACGRPFDGQAAPLLTQAITDYLLLSEEKAGYRSTRSRLAHVVAYAGETGVGVTCAQIDKAWVDGFRKWLSARPVVSGVTTRPRSIGAVEGCVLQLAAAINATPGQSAQFRNEQPVNVAASPRYRADVKILGAMFRFAMDRPERANLLRYLRIGVATWARPEEIFDVTREQWIPAAGVLNLNPAGRRQTRKYRTTIPVARQFAPHLDAMGERYMPVTLVRASWEKMRVELGLPAVRGESGIKLLRRSVSTIARKRIGEANWMQGRMMLGHVKHSISDIYALPDPANLGLALTATEAILDEIEAIAPGAYRIFTASGSALRVVKGGKSG